LTFSIEIATSEKIDMWNVCVDKFNTVASSRPYDWEVDVVCTNVNNVLGYLLLGEQVTITYQIWTEPLRNEASLYNVEWSSDIVFQHPHISNGWEVPKTSDTVIVYNFDNQTSYVVSDFAYHVDTLFFSSPIMVTYDHSILGNYTIPISGSYAFSTPFGYLINGFAYFHYTLSNSTGYPIAITYGTHGNLTRTQPIHTGGQKSTVDKIGILGPYIGLAVAAAVGAVATTALVKRGKRKQ
jgi:hypothetical protein